MLGTAGYIHSMASEVRRARHGLLELVGIPGMARGGRARPLPRRRTRSAARAPLRALRRAARPAAFLHARAPRAVPGAPDHVLAPRPLPGPPAPSALPPRPRPCLARLTSAWPSPHSARPCPARPPPTAWAAGLATARAAAAAALVELLGRLVRGNGYRSYFRGDDQGGLALGEAGGSCSAPCRSFRTRPTWTTATTSSSPSRQGSRTTTPNPRSCASGA